MGDGARVLNNDVITTVGVGSGLAYGIRLAATDSFAVNNRITAADRGIDFTGGTGKYRDTLTSSVTTPYTGGTDAGNNQ